MTFQPIRKADWPRAEYFDHYFSAVPCTYSMTAKLDIRAWRKSGRKLYPAMLHAITTVVNRHEEFRTAIGADGQPGIYSDMLPATLFFIKTRRRFPTCGTRILPTTMPLPPHTKRICAGTARCTACWANPTRRKTPFPCP